MKSDAFGAINAGQGLYVSTYAKSATSQQLDVTEAQSQLMSGLAALRRSQRRSCTRKNPVTADEIEKIGEEVAASIKRR